MLYELFMENIEIFDMISKALSLGDLETLTRVCKQMYNGLNNDLLEWYRRIRAVNTVIECINYTCEKSASMRDGVMYTLLESSVAGRYIICSSSTQYQIIHEGK